jgi:trehalose/maltose hydrolase-like predicted phosphorylase
LKHTEKNGGETKADDAGWVLTTTDPIGEDYYPTFTGNGNFAARVPATGQGFRTGTVPTTFEISGFFTGKDVTDVADDSDEDVSKQWRVSGPAWTGLRLTDGSGSFDDAFTAPRVVGAACQLEDADLHGGLSVAGDHDGFHGTGFTEGWGTAGAGADLVVTGSTAGAEYDVVVRYSAGDPGSDVEDTRQLTLTVGESSTALELPDTDDWDTWEEARTTVTADEDRIALTLAAPEDGDSRVNVDQIAVVDVGAEVPEPEPFTIDDVLADYRQSIDLRHGTITTSATWTSPAGKVSDVEYTVLTDRSHDQRALVRLVVTPRFSGEITVTDLLDARSTDQVEELTPHRSADAHRIGLTTTLLHTGIGATVASHLIGPGELAATPDEDLPDGSVGQTLTTTVHQGKTYEFVKYVGLTTSHDEHHGYRHAAAIADAAATCGHRKIRTANDAAWAEIWEGDIQVRGDDTLQERIRASRFYLLTSVGERPWSPSPAGLSSGGYGGHVFWDTETWMWPSLLAQDPELAAAVLRYRSDRIEDAAWNARNTLERKADEQGNENPAQNAYERVAYEGLRFPWESALTGRESTESYFFGGHEVHITADIALAFWQYYLVTGDRDWLGEEGWPVLSGTADFWVSRSTKGEDGQYHVLNVTPPDEWASNGNQGRDDNPYTNIAASRNLEIALQAAEILGKDPQDSWSELAGNFAILMDDENGVDLEYADYDGRTIKQADVVMLTYPWQHEQDDELTAANLDYYEAKVDEEASPSMTDAMHAIVAAELGRADDAFTYTGRSVDGFLRGDFCQYTEERGGGHAFTFLTGAGGFLQEFLYGYSGLRWGADGITLDPILPDDLEEITLTGLHYCGTRFDLRIGRETSTVTVTAGEPLTVAGEGKACKGEPLELRTR